MSDYNPNNPAFDAMLSIESILQKMKPKTFTNLISSNFIFIGGLTRSGKSFLCPIVSSFKRTEMFLVDSIIAVSYTHLRAHET